MTFASMIPTRRRGATLIEILVVGAIVGVLAVLATAGVSAAREASRRAGCAAKLRDLGVACSQFVELNGCYPWTPDYGTPGYSYNKNTPWPHLLPYLEPVLADRCNWTCQDSLSHLNAWSSANYTYSEISVPAFLCPSMPVLNPLYGQSSYAGNAGTKVDRYSFDGLFKVVNSNFPRSQPVPPSAVLDGLTRTALFSEWTFVNRFASPIVDYDYNYKEFDAGGFAEACARAPFDARPIPRTDSFSRGWLQTNCYVHALLPNSYLILGIDPIGMVLGAGSHHPGVVNVCYGDGHVTTASDAIDVKIWRALGSRDDGGPTEGF